MNPFALLAGDDVPVECHRMFMRIAHNYALQNLRGLPYLSPEAKDMRARIAHLERATQVGHRMPRLHAHAVETIARIACWVGPAVTEDMLAEVARKLVAGEIVSYASP